MGRLILIIMLFMLAGCSTTTAILLPEQDGKVGALVLKHGNAEKVVDQPYMAARDGASGDTINVDRLTKEQVEQRYGATLRAEPAPAVSFTLYFMEGTTVLTDESKAQLSEVAGVYKAHAPAKVYIIGHTDRTGSAEFNMQLALDRAKSIEQELRATSTGFDTIEVRSFGENDPLIPTAKGVAEPRNRRVEILIL